MPIGDIYEAAIDMTAFDQNLTNVLHFVQQSADGVAAPLLAIHQIINDNFIPAYQPCVTADLTFVQTRVRRLAVIETQSEINALGQSGTAVGVAMPPHCAAIIRMYGTRSGAKGIGNIKLASIPDSGVECGRTTLAYALLLGTLSTQFFLDQPMADWEFGSAVYSRIDGVARRIKYTQPLPRLKTVYSRQIGVGN